MGKSSGLGTIWEVPDELWAEIDEIILEVDPPGRTGRPRIEPAAGTGRGDLPDSHWLSVEPPA